MNLEFQRRTLERRARGVSNSLATRLRIQRIRPLNPSELEAGDIIKVFHKYEAKGGPDIYHPLGRKRRINAYYGFATPVTCLVVENNDALDHITLQILPGNKIATKHSLQQYQQSDQACLHRRGNRDILLVGKKEV